VIAGRVVMCRAISFAFSLFTFSVTHIITSADLQTLATATLSRTTDYILKDFTGFRQKTLLQQGLEYLALKNAGAFKSIEQLPFANNYNSLKK